ncbi:hypothetical protein BHYA_0062g00380 [Botrytis hyacinthi]|uniref:Uncharacterized protein n=1 Tax=Botrytis hyacinthi TaxID=278943 RepID=A0A4Z1GQ48_9HELO|nr:hypothetical protein BHYA_0062g00380 [Botrytis hyacinthi]
MELDDTWDPDPLPSCSSRNQSQPRFKKEKTHHSQAQREPQHQHYQQLKSSNSQHRNRNAPMRLYQNFSDDESSSDEYPVVLQQPQINHKRVISPAQPAQDRRKRHQSEHPSRIERGRTTNVEEVVYDQISAISRSRNKSVARNDARYKVRENGVFEGYQNVGNSVALSKKSIARSRSRARDIYEDQGYATMEDYNQQCDRQPSVFSSQDNAQTKRCMKEEPTYVSMPPNTDAHRTAGRGLKETSRVNHESVSTPKQRQRHGQSRVQSLAPRISNDNSDIQYLGTENVTYSVRVQRQEKEHQLRSPLWSSHDSATPKSSSANRLQGRIDKPNSMKPPPHTPKNQSNNSGVTIDLVTPEGSLCARNSMPFIPQHWTPTRRGPIRISAHMESSDQDGLGAKSEQQPSQNTHQQQAIRSSPNKGQQPGENIRQRQAAEKIIRQELNADNQALQEELFGEVIRETVEETREREEAKRLEAQRLAEEKEKQALIDAERKRKKNEARAKKESERKAAEQAEKEKEIAAKKAKRDAEHHHQSLKEQQNADERRKAANKILQEKREKDMAVAKAAEEKFQAAEKERKENDAKFEQMKRQLEKLEAQVKAKLIAELKPARKSTTADAISDKVNSLPPEATPSTSMEVDNEGSLPTPQTQITPVDAASNTEKTSPPQVTLPTNTEVEDEDSLFVSDNRRTVVETTPERQISNGLQSITGRFSSDSTIIQSLEHDRPPASMTEIFAKTIHNLSGDKTLEDRDAEREAIRKNRASENAAAKQKRAKSIPAEPNPEMVAHKDAPQTTPKAPTKSPAKKKRTQSLTKSLGGSIFSVKLQPLPGHEREGCTPREQPENLQSSTENSTTEFALSKPRPLPLSLPPPLPLPVRSTTTSSRPETRLISQTEREEIEANCQRVQAAAQARKENSNRARLEEKKAASAKKRTVEYRKRKEKELIEEARKEGRILGDSELEARLNKLMEKREIFKREINRKRNRSGEKISSNEHEHEHEPASGTSIPDNPGRVVTRVSSSDTASDFNQIEEDGDSMTRNLKEHKIKTAEILKERAQSYAARRIQPQVKKLEPIFDSDESEESEEDPIDDETLEMMKEQARKNKALTEVAKAGENNDEIQSETRTEEEIAFEKEIEGFLEEDPNAEGESEEATPTLNPDEHSAQIVPPMPNMTRYFEGQSTPRSSSNPETQSPLLGGPSQTARTVPHKAQQPASYKMVNLYMVMTQVTLHEHEDEAVLKKKFFDLEKANKHAQMLVCMIDRTAGFADASKLYTVLEMANHAAAEYVAKEIEPKEEEHHTTYVEELLPQVRTGRDACTKIDELFCCEVTGEQVPWADFKTFEVNVELWRTEGPIN